jgi:site-specific recombinase XerC
LDVGDYISEFGLRRVCGKGGYEASVPLPEVARRIVSEYLAVERGDASAEDPLFVVRFKVKGGGWRQERMRDHRVFKVVKALGKQVGLTKLHPHAFRHSCGVELLRRTRGTLRAVQEHLRHADIQTTTLYTRLTQQDLQRVVSVFDRNGD